MDISRDLGTGITMIIPAFVGSGLVWELFGSWIGVILWIIVMAFIYGKILSARNFFKKIGI